MESPLHIPPSKKWKGLTVYCYKCKTNVSEICKETGKVISKCPFGERHAFKIYVHVPGTDNERRTKTLNNVRDVNEAIKQAIEFEKEIKQNIAKSSIPPLDSYQERVVPGQKKNIPHLLISAIARYVGWLHNEAVPTHRQKNRSSDYIKDIERKLQLLVNCLKMKGYDLSTFRVDQIDDGTVGHVFDYLKEEANFSSRTFNKHFTYFTSFLKWFSEEYYPVRNWFERVEKEQVISTPKAITQQEYEALLSIITPERGIQHYQTGVKTERNFYRPYLKDAFRLALETGRRREEIINLKYNAITEYPNGSGFIQVEDYKINHIQNRTTKENKKYIDIPITNSLRKILNEIGYENLKGTDNYILAPEVKDKRNKVMADLLSRSFTHYYKQLNTGRELTFKSFRKRYITSMAIYMRGSEIASKLIGHTNEQTTDKYYLVSEEMATALQDFKVFPPELERSEELKIVRERNINEKKAALEK